MSTIEIKGKLHELIVKLKNKDLLLMAQDVLDDLVAQDESKENGWDELSPTQHKELDEALDEAEDEANLISNEEVFKKYRKWLEE